MWWYLKTVFMGSGNNITRDFKVVIRIWHIDVIFPGADAYHSKAPEILEV
jgi:hypothetical protein